MYIASVTRGPEWFFRLQGFLYWIQITRKGTTELDLGSQSNLVTSDLVRELKLACRNEIHPISGINKIVMRVNKITRMHIKSKANQPYKIRI